MHQCVLPIGCSEGFPLFLQYPRVWDLMLYPFISHPHICLQSVSFPPCVSHRLSTALSPSALLVSCLALPLNQSGSHFASRYSFSLMKEICSHVYEGHFPLIGYGEMVAILLASAPSSVKGDGDFNKGKIHRVGVCSPFHEMARKTHPGTAN